MAATESRLFVGGIPAGTGAEDLRRHFSRYGEVADVCLPAKRDRGPSRYAFVQFTLPTDAGRALAADQQHHHVIHGRQVRVARADEPRHGRHRGGRGVPPRQHQQREPDLSYHRTTCRVGGWRYRVGDTLRLSWGPLLDQGCCEGLGFGSVVVDNVAIFDCAIIEHISEDGKQCVIRWPAATAQAAN